MDKNEMARIESKILTVRGCKVILDADLAQIYGVPTKVLNQAVKRNFDKFPSDFMYQHNIQELAALPNSTVKLMRSQTVTASRKRNNRFMPYAFTAHGAIMAATILNSSQAVQMSVFVVRAFVLMRQALLSRNEMEQRLDKIEKVLLVHDDSLKALFDKIRPLLLPPPVLPVKQIGFGVKESRSKYALKQN